MQMGATSDIGAMALSLHEAYGEVLCTNLAALLEDNHFWGFFVLTLLPVYRYRFPVGTVPPPDVEQFFLCLRGVSLRRGAEVSQTT